MFPSHPLSLAIQAERERELDRRARERRLLAEPYIEPVVAAQSTRAPGAGGARPAGRPERSSGPACEAL
jgi:hypothetical protein